ncbi:MAG: AsmA family protein [Burkholderiaceae bacterium]|nr:AsmA family protein [Burkholderiaceae bacterium]
MKIWLKRVLISLVVVFIVALVSIAIFLLTFDPNAYKSKLGEIVYSRYHRTLAIKGDIQLSLFPRIGLSVSDVSLSNRESTELFASVDSARFAVAIWPLLSNRLVVDHVAVTGFKAWLVRDKDGLFNFSDLAGYGQPQPVADSATESNNAPKGVLSTAQASEPAAPVAAAGWSTILGGPVAKADLNIDIAGLDLKNGEIHWRDVVSGADLRVEQLDINTGRVTFDQAFDVAIKGNILGEQPLTNATLDAQAIVKLDPSTQNYSAQKISLQISGAIGDLQAKTAGLRGNLAYNVFSQMLGASNIEMQLQGDLGGNAPIKGLDSSLTVSQLKVDRSQAQLQLEKLAFRAKGNWPDQRFDMALDAPSLAVSPDMAKGGAITSTLKVSGGPNIVGVSMGLSGLGGNVNQLTFKELKFEGNLKQGERLSQLTVASPATWKLFEETGSLSAIKGDVRIEDAAHPDSAFQFPFIGSLHADLFKDELSSDINAVLNGGKIDFKVQAKQLADPKVVFGLVADKLDLSALLPSAEPVTIVASDKPAAKTDKGAAQPAGNQAASPHVDLSFLDGMDIQGKIAVDRLVHHDFLATDVAANVLAKAGKLDISGIKAVLYQGKLAGRLTATSENAITADLALDSVDIGPLLIAVAQEKRLLGKGTLKAKLQASGTTLDALKAALDGSIQLSLRDGAIRGINVAQTLREAQDAVRNVFSGQLPDMASEFDMGRQTDFSALDANVDFSQGQGTIKKLNLVAPLLRVSQGTPASIDLANQQLDLLINVKVVNTKTGQDGKELAELQGVTVPMRVSGPFDALGYQVQWQDIGSSAVKQAVKDGLLDMLSRQAGKAPDAAASDDAKKTDRVKSIGNALKGLLGQ